MRPTRRRKNLIAWAFDQDTGSPMTTLLLVALADFANKETLEAWPSLGKLQAKTKMDRKAVIRHIKKLCELGLIVRHYPSENGKRKSNTYLINLVAQSHHQVVAESHQSMENSDGSGLEPPNQWPRTTGLVADNHLPSGSEPPKHILNSYLTLNEQQSGHKNGSEDEKQREQQAPDIEAPPEGWQNSEKGVLQMAKHLGLSWIASMDTVETFKRRVINAAATRRIG